MSDLPLSMREQILQRLQALVEGEAAGGFFPAAGIDEPEPRNWRAIQGTAMEDAANVADGPVESLAFANGAAEPSENELDAAIAYVVAGGTSAERRARRDQGGRLIASLIAADPTLGLGPQVFAECQEPVRDDNVPIPHSKPIATVVTPISVLYAGIDKAD